MRHHARIFNWRGPNQASEAHQRGHRGADHHLEPYQDLRKVPDRVQNREKLFQRSLRPPRVVSPDFRYPLRRREVHQREPQVVRHDAIAEHLSQEVLQNRERLGNQVSRRRSPGPVEELDHRNRLLVLHPPNVLLLHESKRLAWKNPGANREEPNAQAKTLLKQVHRLSNFLLLPRALPNVKIDPYSDKRVLWTREGVLIIQVGKSPKGVLKSLLAETRLPSSEIFRQTNRHNRGYCQPIA